MSSTAANVGRYFAVTFLGLGAFGSALDGEWFSCVVVVALAAYLFPPLRTRLGFHPPLKVSAVVVSVGLVAYAIGLVDASPDDTTEATAPVPAPAPAPPPTPEQIEAAAQAQEDARVQQERVAAWGAPPMRSEWDGSYAPVTAYLRRTANDPGSIDVDACTDVRAGPNDEGWVIGCDYRGRNAFNALIRASNWFVIRYGAVIEMKAATAYTP